LSSSRTSLAGFALLLWVSCLPGLALPAAVTAQAADDAALDAPQETPDEARVAAEAFNSIVTRALEHFRARDFAAAATQFDLALTVAPAGADVGTLHFNAAASLYELGRFGDAEQRFARTAAIAPELAPLALLNAGMAALQDGRVDVATRYAADAPAGGHEAETRRSELKGLIAQTERSREKEEFYRALKDGIDAYAEGNIVSARRSLARSLALQASATPRDRATLHLTLGEIALEQNDRATARRSLDQALREDPANAEAYIARAELAWANANADAAEADALRALGLAKNGASADRARRLLERLDVLPSAGASFVAMIGTGYDSNASQSGTAELAGVGATSASQPSALVSAAVQFDFTLRTSRNTAIVPYYLGDFFAPTSSALQPLTLQAHELGSQLHWRPIRELGLRFTAGSSLVLSGLNPVQPFTWEGVFGTRADLATSEHATTSFDLTLRPSQGLGDRAYLSGLGLDGVVEERFTFRALRVSLGAGYRNLQYGTLNVPIEAGSSFAECSRRVCNNLAYAVPLGYHGPSGRLAAAIDLLARLSLGASAKVEYRRYLEPNFVRGLPNSRKTREDGRYRLRAHGELGLDTDQHVSLLLSYEVLISRSNIAFDADDSHHRFDYGDRNFVEHLIELGLELRL